MTDHASDLVYGIHPVGQMIEVAPRRVRVLWLAATKGPLGELFERARAAGVRVEVVDRRALDKRVRGVHQGAVALCHGAELADEDELHTRLGQLVHPGLVLALDGIQDPRNLGACLRCAEAAGVHAVLLPKRRSAPVTAVARKTAAGAAESLFLVEVTNLVRALVRMKEEARFRIVGAAGDAGESWAAADWTVPTVLVVGGEENGLRSLTRASCDVLVSIPMAGAVASLNVSVATGVLLFEAVRQRRDKPTSSH